MSFNRNHCLICQKRKSKNEDLSKLGETGKTQLLSSAKIRKEAHDPVYSQAIERILEVFCAESSSGVQYLYHRCCYAIFTNKAKVAALVTKASKFTMTRQAIAQEPVNPSSSSVLTRSRTPKMNWEMCILCQKDKEEHLRLVMSENMNSTIFRLAKFDYCLHVRTSAVSDLIAEEAKYHSSCILQAERRQKKIRERAGSKDSMKILPFSQICFELRNAASLQKVFKLDDVWNRYLELVDGIGGTVPLSFSSRRSTFKEKLQAEVGDVYQFFQPLDKASDNRNMLLIPNTAILRECANVEEEDVKIPVYEPDNSNNFWEIVHTALKIRNELKSSPGHNGLHISKDASRKVVPQSLHLFLCVLLQGEAAEWRTFLDCEDDSNSDIYGRDDGLSNLTDDDVALSIAQDIVYAASKHKKLTPKHIGLALTLHQATHNKKLVNLFHAAGHCIPYHKVLEADRSLASLSFQNFDSKSGAVTPQNFVHHSNFEDCNNTPLLHLTADNIDILTDTLDGKKTFHATQMVAFQRSASEVDDILDTIQIGDDKSFHIPAELNELSPVLPIVTREPRFQVPVNSDWYDTSDSIDLTMMSLHSSKSHTADMTFAISRAEKGESIGWTEYNRKNTDVKSVEISAMGYMPLILNPAHETSTLCTVLNRCIAVADALGEKYVVLTVDQALYCKLIELRWNSDMFTERIILRMGGLHIALNFLKTIGKHMEGSGLSELWSESGLLAEGSITKVLDGKAYSKGMRAHKLTFQAIWRLLYPQFLDFLDENDEYDTAWELKTAAAGNNEELKTFLSSARVRTQLSNFLKERSERDSTFSFWWSYVDMVFILLMFTRGIRAGDWETYLNSLSEILPYIAWYDHLNYLKSLTVYIADMKKLPPKVENAFRNGDFGVLRSKNKFAQVDPDHAQEWTVGMAKNRSGGIIGFTQDARTLQRWALSLHWRSVISEKTMLMYHCDKENISCKEENCSRQRRDFADENALFDTMKTFNLFSEIVSVSLLHNIATKDVATEKISSSLLNVKKGGKKIVDDFVKQRLILNHQTCKPDVTYHATVHRNNPLTMLDINKSKECNKNDSKAVKKADRDFLHKLVLAYEAGRKIGLRNILRHELCDYPVSLALGRDTLRLVDDKSILVKEILKETSVSCPSDITLDKSNSILIIDGMAFVISMGRPADVRTFGDFATAFARRVQSYAKKYTEIHIVFDRYRPLSVKGGTRSKRTRTTAPVRRVITDCNVPIPQKWSCYLSMPENKTELIEFLSEWIVGAAFDGTEVIVAGGFQEDWKVKSTNAGKNLEELYADHEEADSRIVLHAVKSHVSTIVVMARDTDVILLLMHHYAKMNCSRLFVMYGTAKSRKFFPVHEVTPNLQPEQLSHLMAFHAVTGCDTTSKLASITKSSAWKIFRGDNCSLLKGLGEFHLPADILSNVETFVTRLFKVHPEIRTCDESRNSLFGTVKALERLPPTSDALNFHIRRCHYQVCVYKSAHVAKPKLPALTDCGWEKGDGKLHPVLKSLEAIPKACLEVVTCGCKGLCTSRMCSCRKLETVCMKLCGCKGECMNALNV